MRFFPFILSFLITAALIWALKTPGNFGKTTLPPIGEVFNPFTGFWTNGKAANQPLWEDIAPQLPGLSQPVHLVFDDLGVPHIFAGNLRDACLVQGYLTARDRLFQMDLSTRKSAGRLSEVLGERTLEVDLMSRRRGLGIAAERGLEAIQEKPEVFALLQAYSDGVNAWINGLSPQEYPVEYKLIDFSPEAWTPLKSMLMVENMADNLTGEEKDLAATNTLKILGKDTFDLLFPDWNPKQQPIVPDYGQWKDLNPVLPQYEVEVPDEVLPGGKPGRYSGVNFEVDPLLYGSNNWALAGSKTNDGNTLLANDPHLGLTLPSIWYQIQLHTPELNAYGVSLPGVPGIVIGFNENIAWGVTNVSHDVSDWFHIAWTDAQKSSYLIDGQIKSVETRVETIGIKGQNPLVDSVIYTVWGPVVYGNQRDHPLQDYSLRWLSHEKPSPNIMNSFLGLAAAKNYEDYRNAIQYFDNPAQNMVFASVQGDIAIQPQGRYPLRGKGQGRFLLNGAWSEQGWQGYIPQEYIPTLKNPPGGFVFSANQHTTPPSYPYYYTGNFEDFRGRRIHNRLTQMKNASVDSMKTMQLDNFSQRAADALPLMLALLDQSKLDDDSKSIVTQLKQWSFRYDPEELAPPFFDIWLDSLVYFTWDELIKYQKQKIRILIPETWRLIELIEKEPNHPFFDALQTAEVETAKEMVTQAFKAMEGYFNANPSRRVKWSQFQPTQVRHVGLIPAFGRSNLLTGGHSTAPNAIKGESGPSWRMIVSLGASLKAYGVYPGGQSGDPASPFYDNMLEAWVKGDYFELLLMKTPADSPSRTLVHLTLQP